MPFDWDPAKRLGNLAKQGVYFASVEFFEWDSATIQASSGRSEPRLSAYGSIAGRLRVLVFSVENRATRVISLRKANEREMRRWQSAR